MSSAATRVVIVTNSSAAYGAELLLMQIATELGHRGLDVAMAGPSGGELERATADHGVRFVGLDLRAHGGIRGRDGEGRPGPRALLREVRTMAHNVGAIRSSIGKGEIVHSNSMAIHLAALTAARTRRAVGVAHLHDLVRPGLGRGLLAVIAVLSRRTIAISNAVAVCVPKPVHRRVTIIPNGTPLAPIEHRRSGRLRQLAGVEDDTILVGCVARLHPAKRQDLLLEAWGEVAAGRDDVHLAIIGGVHPGQEQYAASLTAIASPLEDTVSFLGRVDDVAPHLADLDVLAHPALAEPFGLSIIEAQAHGCPVVVSGAGGAAEIVENNVTGLVFRPDDKAQLAQQLRSLIDDADRRRDLGAAGEKRVRAYYGLERQVDAVEDLYRSLTR